MNLILSRERIGRFGCFGTLQTEAGAHVACTLEHAYFINDEWVPKVPVGTYTCVRGRHWLSHSPGPFETFEITEVPGCTGILFHSGNLEKDSSGCVLLGLVQGDNEVVQSRAAMSQFMDLQAGEKEFTLVVR